MQKKPQGAYLMKKKPQGGYVRGWHIEVIERPDRMYFAELWWNPYDGRLVATTAPALSRQSAWADARRVINPVIYNLARAARRGR